MNLTKEEFSKIAAEEAFKFVHDAKDSELKMMLSVTCIAYAGQIAKRLFNESGGEA